MGNKGSKRKEVSRVTDHDRSVLELKLQRDRLKQYKKKINGVMERETEIAKQLLREGKKPAALLALKKKKAQEKMLMDTETKIDSVESWVNSLESAARDKQIFEAMKVGKDALDAINKEMSLDAVEQLLLETEDAQALHKQIEETLMGKLAQVDEEEMEKELDAMLEAQDGPVAVPTPAVQHAVQLPDVPTKVPVITAEAAGARAASRVSVAEGGGAEDDDEEDDAPMPPPPKKDAVALELPDVPAQAPFIHQDEAEEEGVDGVPLPPPARQLAGA